MSTVASLATDLSKTFSGPVLQPGDAAYDEARLVHNGLIDKHPALIAQCRGMADIADAVKAARSAGLEVSVRGGGHNIAGRAVTEGGLMIDLSPMRGVHVDPARRTATVGGGALWKEFNRNAQAYGLATTGGVVGTTGVGGLTLGGGLGWMMGKYGMALDNLLSAELVLADGTLVHASADHEPDLFWAIRGGGGNFGIAGSFEFRLHEVGPTVIGGLVAWPIDHAIEVLHFFRDFTRTAPDDLMAVAALLTAPDGSGHKIVGIAAGHFGGLAEGEAAVKPIKGFGRPAMDLLGPMPYVALNGMLDGAFPKGALNYWKSHFIDDLTDQALAALVDVFRECPTPLGQVLLEHFHGAATRVPVADTAYALRATGYNALVLAEWLEASETDACTHWAKTGYAGLRSFVGQRRYLNYMDHDDSSTAVLEAVYGPNLPRLRQLKKKYDPDNFFHLNVNIPPA